MRAVGAGVAEAIGRGGEQALRCKNLSVESSDVQRRLAGPSCQVARQARIET